MEKPAEGCLAVTERQLREINELGYTVSPFLPSAPAIIAHGQQCG